MALSNCNWSFWSCILNISSMLALIWLIHNICLRYGFLIYQFDVILVYAQHMAFIIYQLNIFTFVNNMWHLLKLD